MFSSFRQYGKIYTFEEIFFLKRYAPGFFPIWSDHYDEVNNGKTGGINNSDMCKLQLFLFVIKVVGLISWDEFKLGFVKVGEG